jgi:elongation factor 1-gamma
MNNLTSIAETKTESFLIKNPNGKIPLLETNEGPLFESNAIMRYVASQSTNSLLGESLF